MHKNYLVGYKLFFGLLGVTALVTEVAVIIERGAWQPANFFSFFTVQSNIVAALVLIASAFMVFASKQSRHLDFLRGAVTLYMVVTGVVFALLLSGLEGVTLTAVPWDNIVLHYILPVAVLADWLIDPPRRRIRFLTSLLWLAFPLLYLGYSLIRGAIVGWYPYPFLNPDNGGYSAIALTALAIMAAGLAMAYFISRVKPLKKK
jgi:hypothetical protein